MHPCTQLLILLRRLLLEQAGLTMGEVMWSLAAALLIAAVAVLIGPELGADWREFVGRPHR